MTSTVGFEEFEEICSGDIPGLLYGLDSDPVTELLETSSVTVEIDGVKYILSLRVQKE